MSGKKQILLIENDRIFSAYLKAWLEERGFHVTFSREGLSGIRKAITRKPDLVILDVNLPLISGYEIINELKLHDIKIPFFIISNTNFAPLLREKGKETGVKEQFTFPVNIEELYGKINEYV